jgi:predicted amidohydrolase
MELRIALIQLNSSDDPVANLPAIERLIRQAATEGAGLVLTPEVTNIVSASRTVQNQRLALEDDDATLARLRQVAAETGIWLSLGSLALKSDLAVAGLAGAEIGRPGRAFRQPPVPDRPGWRHPGAIRQDPYVRCGTG